MTYQEYEKNLALEIDSYLNSIDTSVIVDNNSKTIDIKPYLQNLLYFSHITRSKYEAFSMGSTKHILNEFNRNIEEKDFRKRVLQYENMAISFNKIQKNSTISYVWAVRDIESFKIIKLDSELYYSRDYLNSNPNSFLDNREIFTIPHIVIPCNTIFYYFYKVILQHLAEAMYLVKNSIQSIVILEGVIPSTIALNLICRLYQIKVHCIQRGWFQNQGYNAFRNLEYDAFLCYGSYFHHKAIQYNKFKYIENIGNPYIDCKKNISEKVVIGLLLQPADKYFSEFQKQELINFVSNLRNRFDNLEVIMRYHPNDKEYERNFNISLSEFLNKCTICISFFSSTLIESISVNCIPLLYNPNMIEFEPNFIFVHHNQICYSLLDIEEAIIFLKKDQNIIVTKERQKDIKKELFNAIGQKSINNLKSVLKKLRNM